MILRQLTCTDGFEAGKGCVFQEDPSGAGQGDQSRGCAEIQAGLAVSRAWGKMKGVGYHDGWDVGGEGIPEVSGWVTRWTEGLCQVGDWVSLANLCIPKA